ncbi:trypsin-like peptidase domain-containing protein [Streptomyces chiangmaiensis]|uniref:Trypsin-like peptidase domain-containing protein n=1 Tax=Streptomyces chiangmaiensis TaxID=766497 RepID=A0ABU7FJ51_9ACTN|nr:trypsin-like peptidase domain-containing protein [Streptomyces chiangmaiensis]MED7824083.1 trypsin-like peptidase domain-containing protein [Streptomyces chiangmaiensis]
MNEGKPVPSGEAEARVPEVHDGAEAAPGVSGREPSAGVAGGSPARAEHPADSDAAPKGGGDGDYELSRPLGAHARESADAEGDFELQRPAAVRREDRDDHDEARPGPFDDVTAGSVGQDTPDRAAPDPAGSARTAPADRPEPLHAPDPYGTPPYGEPGPWAPAPPVQHPAQSAGTAAHGAVPAPVAAQGAASVSPAPAPVPAEFASRSALPPDPALYSTAWQNYDPWAPQAPFQFNGVPAAGHEQRRGRRGRTPALGAVLLALVAGGAGGVVGAALERGGGAGDVRLPQAGPEPTGRASDSVAGIAARALPSVVTLHVNGADAEGTGTGFVLDDRGHILTNNHVVQPAGAGGRISVTFNGGETAKATVVGRDAGYDLAVVEVSGVRGLRPMPLGNSDNVQVGDPVVAIGAPFDLAGTVTSGIISAKERPITAGGEKGDGSDVSYVDALQTDAPINPGNSGGPLLDSKGRVVGINSAIQSAGNGSEQGGHAGSIGLAFAIPVNQAKRVAEELINTGRATHPVIGVTLDMNYAGDGARVGTGNASGRPAVTAGGPGDKAGIEPGDVITRVDGVRIHSGEELIVKARTHRPGDRLALTVVRDGRKRTITLVLGSAGGN